MRRQCPSSFLVTAVVLVSLYTSADRKLKTKFETEIAMFTFLVSTSAFLALFKFLISTLVVLFTCLLS